MLKKHIFREYDIRGIYNQDFDEDGALSIAKGYSTFLKQVNKHRTDPLTVVVGRDARNSGESLEKSVIHGLLESGINVVSVGVVTSPLLYFSVCFGHYDGGIMITASHNPKEYNGFKLQGLGASSICGKNIKKIYDFIEKKDFVEGEGALVKEDFKKEYFDTLNEITDFKKNNWTIAIDCGNGVAGKYNPEFFKRQGFKVHELYCDLDGSFPNHDADPEREENLKDLKNLVIEKKCDFGIAFDGDGDRVGIIDKKGNHFSADLLLLLLAREMLSRDENAGSSVVYDLKSTDLLKEEIENQGGRPIICKTGHSFVEESMEKHEAILGGEVSGHIFIAEKYFGFDDALLASAKLLEIAISSDKCFTDIFAELPETFITPEEKILVSEKNKFEIIKEIVMELQEDYPDSLTIDGIKVDFGDSAWGIVRASNTSPYITTRFEARTTEKLKEIKKIILDKVNFVVKKY